jgi:hypothetical protein
MILGLEIAMLIMGILAIVRGKVSLTKTLVVEGTAARIVGVIMILPLPLVFGVVILWGIASGARGKQLNENELRTTGMFIEAGITIGCFLLALLIAAMTGGAQSRKFGDYDELDDTKFSRRQQGSTAFDEPGTVIAVCPHCKVQVRLPSTVLGRTVKCGSCQGQFQAPAPPPDIRDADEPPLVK